MAWIGALAAAGSAIVKGSAEANAAKGAAGAKEASANRQLDLQRQVYNSQIQNLEPWRATGQGANNLLAQLYGLPYMDYKAPSPINSFYGGAGSVAQPGATGLGASWDRLQKSADLGYMLANMAGAGKDYQKINDLFNPGHWTGNLLNKDEPPYKVNKDGTITLNGKGGGKEQVSGTIDPRTGVFTPIKDPNNISDALNKYLQTGKWDGEAPDSAKRFLKAVGALKSAGWDYSQTESAQAGLKNPDGTPAGYHEGTGKGDLSVFQNSPGYNFRLNEGLRAVQNSAAARGGLGGGNSLRAVNDYAQGTASDDFYNFVNQMNILSGRGGTAAEGQNSAGGAYAINGSNSLGQFGDARASGIIGQANAFGGAVEGIGGAFGDWWGNKSRQSGVNMNGLSAINPSEMQSQYRYNNAPLNFTPQWNNGSNQNWNGNPSLTGGQPPPGWGDFWSKGIW